MYHHGFDKFGRSRSKGETDYRTDSSQLLRRVLVGTAEENSAWSYNSSRKRFDDHFGDAVKTDIHYATETGEWNRKVIRGGKEHVLLCNPEDVRRTSACKHDDRTVCTKCQISIGNECKIGNIESIFNNKLMKICTSLWMYTHILWICKSMHVFFLFDLLCVNLYLFNLFCFILCCFHLFVIRVCVCFRLVVEIIFFNCIIIMFSQLMFLYTLSILTISLFVIVFVM